MVSSKIVRRRRGTHNCILLLDSLSSKSSKLFGHVCSTDRTSLKLLDLLAGCQDQWCLYTKKLKNNYHMMESEVNRLKLLQEETAELLRKEIECKKRVERSRDSLKKKINAIRQVLLTNDVDEAKRQLDTVDLSGLTPNKLSNSTCIDHSAGSLLDPANVSVESCDDDVNFTGRHSSQRKRSWANRTLNLSQSANHRPVRLSKSRSSSVPKFTTGAMVEGTAHTQNRTSSDRPRPSRKRSSDKSDEPYFDVEVKKSAFDLSEAHTKDSHAFVPSTVPEESSTRCSTDTESLSDSQRAALATPKPALMSRLNRPHDFVSRSVLRMDTCSVCGKRITFGKTAYKCSVCRLIVHPACRKELVQTCIPPSASRTPLPTTNRAQTWLTSPRHAAAKTSCSQALVPALPFGTAKHKGLPLGTIVPPPASPTLCVRLGLRNIVLSDLCPEDQFPRIPALIIHCITEVVARGMNTVGIYRVSGSEKQVRSLYDKFFRSKMTPGLALIDDIHVVCGCLKMFLRNLSEPLVTFEQRPILAAASEQARTDPEGAIQQVMTVLNSLPIANRDTLSYIVLHLKMVARTPACQMGEDNLSKVFGPTLVGYSCPDPQPMQTVTETRTQQAVVKLLFNVPDQFYSEIIRHPPSDENREVEQEQSTYFSPVSVLANCGSNGTPMRLRQTPIRLDAVGMSSRKRFLPSLIDSNHTNLNS